MLCTMPPYDNVKQAGRCGPYVGKVLGVPSLFSPNRFLPARRVMRGRRYKARREMELEMPFRTGQLDGRFEGETCPAILHTQYMAQIPSGSRCFGPGGAFPGSMFRLVNVNVHALCHVLCTRYSAEPKTHAPLSWQFFYFPPNIFF